MAKASEKKRKLEEETIQQSPSSKRVKATSNGTSTPKSQGLNPSRTGSMESHSVKGAIPNASNVDVSASKKSGRADKKDSISATKESIESKTGNRQHNTAPLPQDPSKAITVHDDTSAQSKQVRKKKKRAQAIPNGTNNELRDGWILSPRIAGRYINHDPIFVQDQDEDYLIAAKTCEIQLLSLDGSHCERSFPIPEGRKVTCFALSTIADEVVDIALDNGEKLQWAWTAGEVTKSTFPGRERALALTRTRIADSQPQALYIARNQEDHIIVLGGKLIFTTSQKLQSIHAVGEASYIVATGPTTIVLGSRKQTETDAEYIWVEIPVLDPILCSAARFSKPIGAKKARATDLTLAVGNAKGQIHLYSNLSSVFKSSKQAHFPTPRILHWHRDAVSAVTFSKDGEYLISGGKETVLVLWQLETGKRQYLPHLTCEIERIVVSPDGTRYALQMGDNSIMVLSTSELKPVANFPGIQLPVNQSNPDDDEILLPEVAAVLNPHQPGQVLMTVPSTQPKRTIDVSSRPFLQSFDIYESHHLKRQALTRNNVTDFESNSEGTSISPPDVCLLSISADGQWLATVDEWIPPASDLEHAVSRAKDLHQDELQAVQEQQARRREMYLKFWRFDLSQDLWTLSTRVDAPHTRFVDASVTNGAGRVLQLVADPVSNLFATVGEDGRVMTWRPKTRTRHGVPMMGDDGAELVEWTCRDVIPLPLAGSALDKADTPVDEGSDTLDDDKRAAAVEASLAFSEDGSILACALIAAKETAMPLVHLVSPHMGKILSSKAGLIPHGQDIEHVALQDRYLISVSAEVIRVWNLVDDHHHWTVDFGIEGHDRETSLFACNHDDGTFAVISSPTRKGPRDTLRVYNPLAPEALYEIKFEVLPVALLSAKGVRGYTIIFEDGTIRRLAASLSTILPSATTIDHDVSRPLLDSAATESDEPTLTTVVLRTEGETTAADGLLLTADDERAGSAVQDDRPVVRPEQLASIFEAAPSFAMPPVRDMFAAVIELFGRKPLPREIAA